MGASTLPLIVAALALSLSNMIVPAVAFAQQSGALSVTVTPPLIQLTIGPGETWTSSVKIVNSNTYDVTYYSQVMDMEANGEDGHSKFIPLVNIPQEAQYEQYSLARWIDISTEPITVAAGSSMNVPFTIRVPKNAEPGGHYAAIMVGTQPSSIGFAGSRMNVSSFVSTLILLQIRGDVVEQGRIREFSTSKSLYQTPDVDFTLRFENTGNTHVKPEGQVTIYNMWGKERGAIAINQDPNFGNVLPQSIRRFQFTWSSEQNIFDIGQYSAVAALSYGTDGKKTVTATAYFWVVPVVPVSVTLGSVLLFIVLIAWMIRRYIRRALALERMRYGIAEEVSSMRSQPPTPQSAPIIQTLMEPIREGVVDLRAIRAGIPAPAPVSPNASAPFMSKRSFFSKYKLFFLFVFIVIAGAAGAWWYFAKVLVPERPYQVSDVTVQEESPQTP